MISLPNKFTLAVLLVLIVMTFSNAQEFKFGVDLSYVNEMEDCGTEYKVNNIQQDPYQIFMERGTDVVRLRLWHTPAWYDELNSGQRYSDFDDVRSSITRAKDKGMQVLLDFHLSDNWADPSNQVAPEAWWPVVDDLLVLEDSLYNYIFQTLSVLAAEKLLPEIVQIGNETNKGILLSPEQNSSGWMLDWDRNAALFNTAIQAVRDVAEYYQAQIKIAIHIADPSAVDWYIVQFLDHDVTDFDIIGISYYWQWHMDTFEDVGDVIASLRSDHPDKEVMILETAYPWTSANADAANNLLSIAYPGYSPFSPEKQKDWLIDLTQTVIDNGGSAVFYWEPGWVSTDCRTQWAKGSHWDNAIFFNSTHELIGSGGIGWMSYPYNFPTSLNHDLKPEEYYIYQSGRAVIIESNTSRSTNEDLIISFVMPDGRSVYNELFIYEANREFLRIEIPDISAGVYLFTIHKNDNHPVARMIVVP